MTPEWSCHYSTPASHDETGNSTNPPNPTGYTTKHLPRTPSTEGSTTDMMDPTVVPRPNLAVATTTATTLRSGQSPIQITS